MSTLFTPGPVQVSANVLEVLSSQPLHHRSNEFRDVTQHLWERLSVLLNTTRSVHVVPGSGTTAIESAFVSTTRRDESVAIFVHGRFGGRLAEIASRYAVPSNVYEVPWGESITPDEVVAFLSTCPQCQSVWFVHAETSTGVALDIETISQRVHIDFPDMLIAVDAVTSIAVQDLQMDNWGLDVVIGASQKGLSSPPGIGFVALSDRARQAMSNASLPSYNLGLQQIAAAQERGLFVWTPPTNLIAAVSVAVDIAIDKGLDAIFRRHQSHQETLHRITEKHGLLTLGDNTARGLLVVKHDDSMRIVSRLHDEHDITIANGQDELRGKVFRIGTMGAFTNGDFDRLTTSLDAVLKTERAE